MSSAEPYYPIPPDEPRRWDEGAEQLEISEPDYEPEDDEDDDGAALLDV